MTERNEDFINIAIQTMDEQIDHWTTVRKAWNGSGDVDAPRFIQRATGIISGYRADKRRLRAELKKLK